MGGEFFADATTGAEEGNVHSSEAFRREFLDDDVLTLELQCLACAPCGGQQGELANWKVTLFQAADHFCAYRAGGSDDGDMLGLTHIRKYDGVG